ncbi:MAG: DUF937 domain-containing protein [Burkholderiales bacterium]
MVPLLEKLESTITPKAIDAIGTALGIDAPLAQKGVRVIGPTLLGAFAKAASTPEGAASIMGRFSQSVDPAEVLSRALKSLSGGVGSSAEKMANILGGGSNAISSALSRSLGFDAGPLLNMGAPLFMGLLADLARSRNLDASGVAAMLEHESAEFMSDPASKGVARIVQSALEAGDAAVALRKSFTDADWTKIRMAPLATTYLIVTASSSKGSGAVQELGAAAGALMESIKTAAPSSLMGTAFGCGMTMHELEKFKKNAPSRESVFAMIKESMVAVKAKSPPDAQAFSDMLMNVARKAAEAAKEGGFLGIGGRWVSEDEEKTLWDIKAALD